MKKKLLVLGGALLILMFSTSCSSNKSVASKSNKANCDAYR